MRTPSRGALVGLVASSIFALVSRADGEDMTFKVLARPEF
jgi:hypothetical protein